MLGYEIATRAGIALHATVPDYHCSGAWNALGCAAVAARLLVFDAARIRQALGVAEYFGPRGQILRACDSPTMVKDGSGWGAHVGVTAALLARDGFTGAPALTVERDDARALLGRSRQRAGASASSTSRRIPVCRWAQPAVEAALAAAARRTRFAADDVAAHFDRQLSRSDRAGSACAMADDDRGGAIQPAVSRRGSARLRGHRRAARSASPKLADPRVDAAAASDDAVPTMRVFRAAFPPSAGRACASTLTDGRTFVSEPARARGNPENPLADDELRRKYLAYAEPVLGAARAARIEHAVACALDRHYRAAAHCSNDLLQPIA
mgnify:CR=1 FL=1